MCFLPCMSWWLCLLYKSETTFVIKYIDAAVAAAAADDDDSHDNIYKFGHWRLNAIDC